MIYTRRELYKLERQFSVENWVNQAPFMRLAPGIKSRDDAAITGFNGYLFIYNGAYGWEKQLLGDYVDGEFPISQYLDSLTTVRSWADAIGCKVLSLVIPEKQLVFPELRFGVKFDSEIFLRRPLNVFEKEFSSLIHACVYPLEELKLLSKDADVFYRTNSHLSASGTLAVFECLINEIAKVSSLSLNIADLFASIDFEVKWVEHDLAVKFIDNYFLDKIVTLSTPSYVDFCRPANGNLGTKFKIINNKAPYNLKVFILGDSYSYDAGLSYMLSRAFKEIQFVWANVLSRPMIEEAKPDVLILESTERRWFALQTSAQEGL